jgi:ATP-dependent protease ClpP protease subunit
MAQILLDPRYDHVHLQDDVHGESIVQLKETVYGLISSNRKGRPKGILLHVNSHGGSVMWGQSLINIFTESQVNIRVIVNGVAYSMGAYITILAPSPRYMTDASTMLVHNGYQEISGRVEDVEMESSILSVTDQALEDSILSRTKISRQALRKLLHRDRVLTAREALEYGFIDVIVPVINVPFPKTVPKRRTSLSTLGQHVQIPHGYFQENNDNETKKSKFVCMLPNEPSSDDSGACNLLALRNVRNSKSAPVILHIGDIHDNDGITYIKSLPDVFAPLFGTIRAMSARQNVIGILESPVNLFTAVLLQACSWRAMHRHSYVLTQLLYEKARGLRQDVIENSMQLFELLRQILRARCRIPNNILATLETDRIVWYAEDCLKFGIIDEIIDD